MEPRPFGSLGFKTFPIAFGGAAVSGEGGGYGFGSISEKDAIALLHGALERGIHVFDTAPIYGFGLSERRFGKAFADRREKAFLVSKCGVTWNAKQKVRVDNSPETTRKMLEQSLRDLRTDRIDLYFIHWPDPKTDVQETMRVLADAKKDGKIGAIGLSNFLDPVEIRRAMEVERVEVLQAEFNFFERKAASVFPFLKEQNIGFMGYGTLEKGLLSGRFTEGRTFEKTDIRGRWWKAKPEKVAIVEKLQPLLKKEGVAGLAFALHFVLSYSEVSNALCGIRSLEQLESAISALEKVPSISLLDEANALLN